jgi:WD40 repeat protein
MPLDPSTQELSNATKARVVDVSPDGKLCAVGFRDGSFRIYETSKWKMVAKKKACERLIGDMKFSPN